MTSYLWPQTIKYSSIESTKGRFKSKRTQCLIFLSSDTLKSKEKSIHTSRSFKQKSL